MILLGIIIAPLLGGLITKIKNDLRMRQGQSILQPYYNLAKYFNKGEVVSGTASWIFRMAPFVVFASALASLFYLREFLVLIFIFSLGRFFLSLAALDTGSTFGGMGSSREMFISSLSEPVACLACFAVSLQSGSTDLLAWKSFPLATTSALIAGVALFLVMIAETARIPIDNQETHLELTMIHEAMILEYSGRSLALIELASYIRQMAWFLIIAQVLLPVADPVGITGLSLILWVFWYAARIILVAIVISLLEIAVAKMRLFRAIDFFGFGFVLATIAALCAALGY